MSKARASTLGAISAKLFDTLLGKRHAYLHRYRFRSQSDCSCTRNFTCTDNLTKLLIQKTLKRRAVILATHPPLSFYPPRSRGHSTRGIQS
jgi:hypothetical protein